jgi:hypothetical protein
MIPLLKCGLCDVEKKSDQESLIWIPEAEYAND